MAIKYGTETWAIGKLISAQKHTNNIEALRILHAAVNSVRLGPWGKPVQPEIGWVSTCPTPMLPLQDWRIPGLIARPGKLRGK